MPTRSKIKISKPAKRAIKALEKINKNFRGAGDTVKVGLPKGANAYPDGTSVIMVGAVHEFGSPSRNVPQRSYLRTTVVEERGAYRKLFKALSKQIVDGKRTKKEALSIVGLQAQTDVREKITDIKTPPLKDRDGNPLIDTGHLRQSITFEVSD